MYTTQLNVDYCVFMSMIESIVLLFSVSVRLVVVIYPEYIFIAL